jgi:hypothetical protein
VSRLKLVVFSCVAAGLVIAAMPGVAFGHANPSPQDTQNARNNPCADPWVSLAVSISKGPTNGVPGRAAGSGNADEGDYRRADEGARALTTARTQDWGEDRPHWR